MMIKTCWLWVGIFLSALILPAPGAAAIGVKAIAAGDGQSLAIRTDGSLWAWGANYIGQLGLGDGYDRLFPTRVGPASDWTAVAAGTVHSLGLRADGSLWAWGSSYYGQLGLGDIPYCLIPTRVPGTTTWQAIAGGRLHSLATNNNGNLYTWGSNEYGQLGLGNNTDVRIPTLTRGNPMMVIAAGFGHSLVISQNPYGSLWAWGQNNRGQLGLGDTQDRNYISGILDPSCKTVAAGGAHSLAIRDDGFLYAWGDNAFGQLGLGNGFSNRDTPTWVEYGYYWKKIAAGDNYTLGIRTDGTLWAWGGNRYGQLGLGDYADRNIPTQVGTAADWTAIAAGTFHNLGIRADGSLWAWGNNGWGELGQGDNYQRNVPTLVLFPSATPGMLLLLD